MPCSSLLTKRLVNASAEVKGLCVLTYNDFDADIVLSSCAKLCERHVE